MATTQSSSEIDSVKTEVTASAAAGFSPAFLLYLFVVFVAILIGVLLLIWCIFQHYRIFIDYDPEHEFMGGGNYNNSDRLRADQISQMNQRILDNPPAGLFLQSRRDQSGDEEDDGDFRDMEEGWFGTSGERLAETLLPCYEELPPPTYESVVAIGKMDSDSNHDHGSKRIKSSQ